MKMTIKVNDTFMCTKSISAQGISGEDTDAFTKGVCYTAPMDGFLTTNQGILWKPAWYPEFALNFGDYFVPFKEHIRKLNQKEKEPDRFKVIVDKMHDTYIRKNHDYGNSFDVSMDEEGLTAARIRLNDKWLRFKQLSKGEEALVKDESIRDTLLDMANYCIMTVMWMDRNKKEDDKACE